MKIQGSVAVVTGAASGIGKALCRGLSDAGAEAVVVSDVNESGAEVVAAEIGENAVAVPADVSDESSVQQLASTAIEKFGRIDLFCSNAGVSIAGGFEEPDWVWQRSMAVNLMAHVYAARAVIPPMLDAGRGYLLQTSSAAGVLTAFGAAAYAASKHAAVAFAEYLAIHYGDRGIGVSCLCPQAVDTPMLSSSVEDDLLATLKSLSEVLQPEDVAMQAIAGIEAELLHIFPHRGTHDSFIHRAQQPDRWVSEMRQVLTSAG